MLPHVQAIVLCDHIYRDDETGKCVIAGTFNRVFLGEFPGEYHPASIYLNLSDFNGHHDLRFRFVRLSDQQVLEESPGFPLIHDDRREHHECIFDLPPLQFPDPGRYTLEILYDGDVIGHADVEALTVPEADEEDSDIRAEGGGGTDSDSSPPK
ncbi:MAG: hypothetical protein AB7O52_00020 [Planctomycetota bacterium]